MKNTKYTRNIACDYFKNISVAEIKHDDKVSNSASSI